MTPPLRSADCSVDFSKLHSGSFDLRVFRRVCGSNWSLRIDASDAFMTITRIDNFVVGCQGSGAIENNAHPTQACALGCSPRPPYSMLRLGDHVAPNGNERLFHNGTSPPLQVNIELGGRGGTFVLARGLWVSVIFTRTGKNMPCISDQVEFVCRLLVGDSRTAWRPT